MNKPLGYLCENAVGHKYFRLKKPCSVYKPIALYAASKEWVELRLNDLPNEFFGDIEFKAGAKWAADQLREKNT